MMDVSESDKAGGRVGDFIGSSSGAFFADLLSPAKRSALPVETGESRDNVFVCLPPSNIVLCGCFVLVYIALRLSSSTLLRPCATASMAEPRVGEVSGRSCSPWRISFLFFVASWIAHWRFNFSSCASAFCSSSFNSRTLRSWAARAVRKLLESD